jgi:hypothetical protein
MTEAEYFTAQVVFAQLPGHTSEASLALFARHGLSEERQEAVRNRKHSYRKAISEPPVSFAACSMAMC